jgi:hypothetical protein
MNRQQILERERRGARLAGYAAVAAAPLYIASVFLDQSGSVPLAGLDTERYRAIHDAAGQLLASVALRSIAFFLLVFPLLYLFRAAQARSQRVSGPMLGFVFIGPVLLAVQGIIAWIAQTGVASDFVAQAGRGGDIYTLLDDLTNNSAAFDVAANLLFPALLGLIVAMVYVPLQALRVGLLTRFFATMGMALGASSLFIVPALSLLALMIWFGWLGFIILEKVPRGRPPAWAAGEAIPWPKAGEAPQPAVAAEAVVDGDATEVFKEPSQPADHSARRERARKRKRKRRR